jgi:hypothetical protein
MEWSNDQRVEKALAGIPDGSIGTQFVHDLGLHFLGVVISPCIACNSDYSRRRSEANHDGDGHGIDGNWNRLFAIGQEVGGTLQSGGNTGIFPSRKNRSVGLDNGACIEASHQTGWTGLVAKLLQESREQRLRRIYVWRALYSG